jgi:hypothetical protein
MKQPKSDSKNVKTEASRRKFLKAGAATAAGVALEDARCLGRKGYLQRYGHAVR